MLLSLVEDLVNNPIFKLDYKDTDSTNNDRENSKYVKVVTRNDTEVFFAEGNQVRCGSVRGNVTYSILYNPQSDRIINHLSSNNSGTFLAAVGGKNHENITAFALPENLNSKDGVIRLKSYKLATVEAGVKKVIWHSIMSHDAGLVVLTNDSKILLFDLLKPTTKPQLTVNLKEDTNFGNETATSISFGSTSSLSGALTLYITASSGKIYALYPFIHKLATISTSHVHVNEAMATTKDTLHKLENDLDPPSVNDTVSNRPLWQNIFATYSFYSHLWTQVKDGKPLKIEKRKEGSRITELSILGLKLPPDFEPRTQGPLFSTPKPATFCDIVSVSSNEKLTSLIVVSVDDSSVVLNYFVHFLPLIMKLQGDKNKQEEELKIAAQSSPKFKSKRQGYAKPKRGFGFVDLDDDDEPSSSVTHDMSGLEVSNGNYEAEIKYWSENFSHLTKVGEKRISEKAQSASLFTYNTALSYILKLSNRLVVSLNVEWPAFIAKQVDLDVTPLPIPKDNFTEIAADGMIQSCVLVNDRIETNKGAVVLFQKTSTNNLIVRGVEKPNTYLREDTPVATSTKTKSDLIIKNKSSLHVNEPFAKLEADLNFVKSHITSFSSTALPKEPLKNSNGASLQAFSDLSQDVIERTIRMTAFAVNLKIRTESDLGNLKNQIRALAEARDSQSNIQEVNESTKKLSLLEDRHKKLSERTTKLQNKISDAIGTLSYEESLPLSKEEKSWINEVNTITTLLSSESNESLVLKVETLQQQFFALKSRDDNKNDLHEVNKPNDVILAKLSLWLRNDAERIDHIKGSLDSSLQSLHI